MPEMPEVQTICTGLKKYINGKIIEKVEVIRRDLRFQLPEKKQFENIIAKTTVTNVSRRSKYIICQLDCNYILVIHLGMSGKIHIIKKSQKKKPIPHTHVILTCQDGTVVEYSDPRRFGFMTTIKNHEIDKHKFFNKLGIEPFDDKFDEKYLYKMLEKTARPIKNLLLDQKIIAGIGNIYASEILWKACIHPEKAANTITKNQCAKLFAAIRYVLQNAVKAGGSSLKDFTNVDGKQGYFQNYFAVYNQYQKKCQRNKCEGNINKKMQSGRSSFFCPQCQDSK